MAARKSSANPKTEGNPGPLDPGQITVRGRLIGANGERADGSDVTVDLTGVPTPADMQLINALSRTGNLRPESLYAFGCVPSNQNVDSYFTYMDVSSLHNYAVEADLGSPFMNSHRTGGWSSDAELPLGRSYKGMVEDDPKRAGQKIFSSYVYMVRNNRASNGAVNTDDIIAGIDAGVNSDISIQFRLLPGTAEKNFEDRSWLRCSICGNDFLRSDPWGDDPDDCPHWPGEVYKSDGGKKRDLCTLAVMNAHLQEFSAVWSGSTPDAIISKAQRAAQGGFAGQLDRAMIHHLEDVYRCRLVDHTTFQVPIIGQPRKEKIVEPVKGDAIVPVIESEGEPIVSPIKTERTDDEMAVDKQELEDAGKRAAQITLTKLAKNIMDARALDESEIAVLQQAQNFIASGDTDKATTLLAGLIAVANQTDDGAEGEMDVTDPAAEEDAEEEDEEAGETTVNIISLQLSAGERQHYKLTKEENARLQKENRRLTPLAQLGERRFGEVIEETIMAYNYAGMGDGEEIREMLVRMPYGQILTMRDQYVAIGHQKFSNVDDSGQPTFAGGRQTAPADPNQPAIGKTTILTLPSRAVEPGLYQSGRSSR